MILNLRTLTPLHVGDGSQLHAFDYAIHNGVFYRTSQQFFERFLSHLGGNSAEQFAQWSGEILDEMEALEADKKRDFRTGKDFNQKMSDLRKQHTLREFAKKIGQEQAFLHFLKESKVPSMPIQPVAKGEREKQEIRGFQRGVDGIPYLPGSTIKGSIRTALLYHFLSHHAGHGKIERILQDSLERVLKDKAEADKRRVKFNTTRLQKSFAEKIEHLAFFAEMVNERGKRSEGEAQNDLMRCLLVADTQLPKDCLSVENIDLYLVKKLPKGQGMEAQRQRQAPAVEAVNPNTELQVDLAFNVELLLHLHRVNGSEGMRVGRELHFIGWREKAKWLFNLNTEDFSSVPPDAKATHASVQALRDKALQHILKCCQEFTQAQAEALMHWKNHFQKNDRGGMSRELDNGAAPVFHSNKTKFHFGFATGFEGMTAVLYLLAQHKRLFADIMDVFGIGDSPSAWKTRRPNETYRSNPDKFPSSRRLATRSAAIVPLGWIEWVDGPTVAPLSNAAATQQTGKGIAEAQTPREPQYLRGTLKVGAKLDAELVGAGNPGKFKLYIRPDYEPVLEVKYAAGFKESDLGRQANVLVKNLKGKDGVDRVEFVGFK